MRLIERESESDLRSRLGVIPCLIGWHGWAEPRAMNQASISGERQADGEWDVEVDNSNTQVVSQSCNHCSRYRDRPDLDWDEVRDEWRSRREAAEQGGVA